MDLRARRLAAGLARAQLARPDCAAQVRPSRRVEQHRNAICVAVAQHHAASPRLIGSVARGEDSVDSDVVLEGLE